MFQNPLCDAWRPIAALFCDCKAIRHENQQNYSNILTVFTIEVKRMVLKMCKLMIIVSFFIYWNN